MEPSEAIENLEHNIINKINKEFGENLLKLSECDEFKIKLELEKEKIENSVRFDLTF